ncbi:DNA-directed RNA polymerase subunit alpha C-terminal domain-containing protein [Leptolyngbya sp. NIES-2104]|uniref:DNA-directed RNA polymerase subunit alpha C-terminal domain-containing protein n=1 Tax=Leptolyngbya sp. NIES-2104 TaxID=1552121 RepID=UPI0006EC76B2|nr:DNA-directed RNA polymerase subunit alpha C-terminal domain-containing protein [Leptolyngbya sp. NIES-2104]GAP93686.1 hypothetical protein NIES2104_01930 [Leptolyngbya sp. NIES-2104]
MSKKSFSARIESNIYDQIKAHCQEQQISQAQLLEQWAIDFFNLSERKTEKRQYEQFEPVQAGPGCTPIEELNFAVRTYIRLKRAEIHTVEELGTLSEQDLFDIKDLGAKSIEEIFEGLNRSII